MIRQMSVLSIVPCRKALLGEGSTKEGERKACVCLAWASWRLYAPSSNCHLVESYSTPSKGEMQTGHTAPGKGRGLAFCKVCWGWVSFPEMWQLGKRRVAWWLCDAVTFALGHWPGLQRLHLGCPQGISRQQEKRTGK